MNNVNAEFRSLITELYSDGLTPAARLLPETIELSRGLEVIRHSPNTEIEFITTQKLPLVTALFPREKGAPDSARESDEAVLAGTPYLLSEHGTIEELTVQFSYLSAGRYVGFSGIYREMKAPGTPLDGIENILFNPMNLWGARLGIAEDIQRTKLSAIILCHLLSVVAELAEGLLLESSLRIFTEDGEENRYVQELYSKAGATPLDVKIPFGGSVQRVLELDVSAGTDIMKRSRRIVNRLR